MTSYVVTKEFDVIKKIPSVGSNSGLEGVHLNPPAPQRNDKGTIGVSTLQTAAAIGVATLTTIASIAIANKQFKTAKRYWELARERFDHFQTVYRPVEEQEILELSLDRNSKADYKPTVSLSIKKTEGKTVDRLQMLLNRRCLLAGRGVMRDIDTMFAQNRVNGLNYQLRRNEATTQADNDLWYNREMAVAMRGRNMVANSVAYADMALKSYRNQGESLNTALSGASKFLGMAFGLNQYNTVASPQTKAGGYLTNGVGTPNINAEAEATNSYTSGENFGLTTSIQGVGGYRDERPESYSNEQYGQGYGVAYA
jgi:hypothetical protein